MLDNIRSVADNPGVIADRQIVSFIAPEQIPADTRSIVAAGPADNNIVARSALNRIYTAEFGRLADNIVGFRAAIVADYRRIVA